MELPCEFLIHTEKVSDFASTHTDVASRHVGVRTDIVEKFGHEGLAESHDFVVAPSSDREVTSTFSTTHRQRGQSIFESLLKSEKFEYGQVD